jgi:hypothetical protein
MQSQARALGPTIGGSALICFDAQPGQYAFFSWHNVIILVWPNSATGASVERLGNHYRAMLKRDPKPQSHIHVVKAGAGLPTGEARAGFVKLMHEFENDLAAVGVCLLGSGFWASAIQGAVTGMRMLAPRSFEMHIHNDFESLVQWLPAEHLLRTGVALGPDHLLAALNTAFAEGTRTPSRGPQRSSVAAR